jgi:Ca2+-transporting ATPase
MPLDDVLRNLSVDSSKGLSKGEASKRFALYGPNLIPKIKGSVWKVYLAPILNWLINIYLLSSFALVFLALIYPYIVPIPPELVGEDLDLFMAAVAAFSNDQMNQAIFWLAIVTVNCVVAIFQQFRAQKKLEALEKLSTGETRVLRDGAEQNITPDSIVPGDILILEQGDKIPADSRIITCSNLTANEASLTGESVPVTKDHNLSVESDVPLTDMRNMVFFGTYVATGSGRVVATTTGGNTEIGKIQGTLGELNTGDIPLRKKVNRLAKYLGIAAVILMAVSMIWTIVLSPFLSGLEPITEIDLIVVTISDGIQSAMTIMPINIPLLTTIVLLTGVLAMARTGVIIRDLSAVESLGRVSIICTDKTGTLTKNEMTVKFIWDTENLYTITGDGYEPEGQLMMLKDPSRFDESAPYDVISLEGNRKHKDLRLLLTCGGINNDSEIMVKEIPGQGTTYIPMGDPTDAALLTLFRKSGMDTEEIIKEYPVEMEFPFDSEYKRMSKICHHRKEHIVFAKGATEVILDRCSRYAVSKKVVPLDRVMSDKVRELANDFASRGYRVISLAYKKVGQLPSGENARTETEEDLIYLGFASIVDPPRDGVKEAVNDCHSAGINVIMITGDAAATAKTIAENLSIYHVNSLAVEGGDIEELSEANFGRQDQNKVVAMTGDGVNDALALAMSDAGIAMGITGTDVAKEAADLVITDDSFSSIVKGVHQGRGLFNKIRMMVFFYIAINLFESIIIFGGLFVLPAGFNMMQNWQQLLLVATTHSFPGLALVFDKTSPNAMKESPRDSEEIITKKLAKLMGVGIILSVICTAIVYAIALTGWNGLIDVVPENMTGFYTDTSQLPGNLPGSLQLPWNFQIAKATTMLLTIFLIIETTIVLVIRRVNSPFHKSISEPGIERFVVLLGLIVLAFLLLMYVPMAQEILYPFGLEFYFLPLTSFDWLVCISASVPAIIGMEVYKRYLRKRDVTL